MGKGTRKHYGARTRTVDLSAFWSWPRRVPKGDFWQRLAELVRTYPAGRQAPWGVPFVMAEPKGRRVILLARGGRRVTIPLSGKATHLCFLHAWHQLPNDVRREDPTEGLVVAEYAITYADGTESVLPVRARFEVNMAESPGPPWVAVEFDMPTAVNHIEPSSEKTWGRRQMGFQGPGWGYRCTAPLLCPMENPHPEKRLRSLTIRGLLKSPLIVAGLTLYEGADNPARHLPRRTYRIKVSGTVRAVDKAEVDLGTVTRIEKPTVLRSVRWLKSSPVPSACRPSAQPWGRAGRAQGEKGEDLIELVAADDATLSVALEGCKKPLAYVNGKFTTDLPVGDLYVEIWKGFEYRPVRTKVRVRPGQKKLKLLIKRWKDLRSEGWVTADTHVHFISPHTAWLEGQAEGINVVNLLASQWGRLFTNAGDLTGRPGVVEKDTIVFVGTENRNHMLGHMSMLGTGDLPVYPMCCGGIGESYIGDPDFRMLAEWALENRWKGGVVIRPHFPTCGHTEDPVPILNGLVDALEIRQLRGEDFPTQEWYRYLNCGYKVAVCGGTDKMSAGSTLGWMRTYAKLDPRRPLSYDEWGRAVRAGRTFSTTGPVMDLHVEGRQMGDKIRMPTGGGTVEFNAVAECLEELGKLEVVVNGRVIASAKERRGARKLSVRGKARIAGSGWIAARCSGVDGSPGGFMAAHTSPVYIQCGRKRAFDGPAAEHMLALVEGGIEYLNKLATVFDERSRKRMVKLFSDARRELKGRLVVEANHTHHHGDGTYHTHGHGVSPSHTH